jgi:hypothetical protein
MQVQQTIKDTPYHLTYGQHPRVGISNLPVSADILANLRTEAELQDVYLLMNSSINLLATVWYYPMRALMPPLWWSQ